MLDQETINEQLDLLTAHRRTLAHLVQQAAQFGDEVFAPPQTINGIGQARTDIHHILKLLREGGVQVEDDPNDEAPAPIEPVQSQEIGHDIVSGDKVGADKVSGDKVMGDKRIINTEGGGYTEGNIDERQGAFVNGGTVSGSVIGQQTIYQILPVWLRFLSALVIVIILTAIMLRAVGGWREYEHGWTRGASCQRCSLNSLARHCW